MSGLYCAHDNVAGLCPRCDTSLVPGPTQSETRVVSRFAARYEDSACHGCGLGIVVGQACVFLEESRPGHEPRRWIAHEGCA